MWWNIFFIILYWLEDICFCKFFVENELGKIVIFDFCMIYMLYVYICFIVYIMFFVVFFICDFCFFCFIGIGMFYLCYILDKK